MSNTFSKLAICGSLMTLLCGCSTLQKQEASPKGDSWSISSLWKKEYQKPSSLAVIWSPDILTVTGKAPTRGFGGRIFFYNAKSQAIPVDGDVIVHGYFGDPARSQGDNKADKTFAFTAEQLTQHFSPSQLGASYSIWVPWDAAGGFQDQVTLIPSFRTKEGQIVQGAPAKLMLPGKTREKPGHLARENRRLPTQTVSYRNSSSPTNIGVEIPRMGTNMKVTTIGVPKNASLAKRPSKRTYELGRSPQKFSPQDSKTNGGQGVSVGGGNSLMPPLTLPTSKGLEQQTTSNPSSRVVLKNTSQSEQLKIDVAALPQPRLHSLPPPSKNMFKRQQIPRVGMIRQASYSSSNDSP